jgi:beta,beta-carotene 9',10'-dioxygenase
MILAALKESKIVATIPSSWKTCLSFMSSFGMTENYIIFMEQPLLINCVKLAQIGIKGKALRDTFEWTPSEKVILLLVDSPL